MFIVREVVDCIVNRLFNFIICYMSFVCDGQLYKGLKSKTLFIIISVATKSDV